MKISVNCPSYRRPRVETLDYLPYCKVWVDEGEYEEYVKNNPQGSEIISVPKGIQGNLCRIRNYILDEEFKNGVDVVCIIDDDMKGMYKYVNGYQKVLINKNMFMIWLEKYSYLCQEWGFKLWGVNLLGDARAYRQFTPFNTVKTVGGPFMCHLNNPIRFDERFPLKEDYDISLQHLNKYRGILRLNGFFYDVKQSEQSGGCASYRNFEKEKSQLRELQRKWGSDIVKSDFSKQKQAKKKKVRIDYNPRIISSIK